MALGPPVDLFRRTTAGAWLGARTVCGDLLVTRICVRFGANPTSPIRSPLRRVAFPYYRRVTPQYLTATCLPFIHYHPARITFCSSIASQKLPLPPHHAASALPYTRATAYYVFLKLCVCAEKHRTPLRTRALCTHTHCLRHLPPATLCLCL